MFLYLFTESKSVGLVSDVSGKLTSGILFSLKVSRAYIPKNTLLVKSFVSRVSIGVRRLNLRL